MMETSANAIIANERPVDDDDRPARVSIFELDDAALVKRLRTWLREAEAAKRPFLKRRERDQAIYAGEHWDEGDRARAEAMKKPMLTLNMMLSLIGAIIGEERENRQDIKFFGTGTEDDAAVGVVNKILKWVMTSCGGEFRLSDGFEDASIEGEAWYGIDADFFDDPAGMIVIEHVDDCEIFPDPSDISTTFKKGRYLTRVKMWAEDEIEAKWPGKLAALREKHFQCEADEEPEASMLKDIYDGAGRSRGIKLFDKETRRWAVCECHWWQIEEGVVVVDPMGTGDLEELSPQEFEERKALRMKEIAAAQNAIIQAMRAPEIDPATGQPLPPPPMPKPLDAVRRPVKVFYRALYCCDELLEKQRSEFTRLKRFKYVPLRALRNKKEKEWFGYIRPAIDPQLQHNVEQSVIVQLMQLMPKGSWMAPKGAFHDKTSWETKLAQPGKLLEYNAQRGKPEPIPTPPIPRHLIEMAFTRPEAIRSIVGVNHEMTGDRAGSQTGVVIDKRQRAARTVLTGLFDHYRETKIELGRVLLAFIQHYVKPGRVLRIVGPDGKPESVMMSQEAQFARFDVTVDEADSNVNERFEALHVLQTTLPQFAKAGMSIVPEFVDLMPLPTTMRDSWKRQISWEMTIAGRLPPPGWEPGMPPPMAQPALPTTETETGAQPPMM